MIDCPVCDKPVRGTKCVCGWIVPPPTVAKPVYVAPEEYKRRDPTPEQLAAIRKLASSGPRTGAYWTVSKVVNQTQVDHIIRQANHFGPISAAGRFHQDCMDAGVIVDGRYTPRMRNPGEDEDYQWEAA